MHDALEGIFVQWPFYTSIPIKISFGSQDGICRIPSLRPMRRNYTVSCEGLFIRSRDFHRTKFVTTCIPECLKIVALFFAKVTVISRPVTDIFINLKLIYSEEIITVLTIRISKRIFCPGNQVSANCTVL